MHHHYSITDKPGKTEIDWIVDDPTMFDDKMTYFLAKLKKIEDIEIKFTTVGSIGISFSCKTKEAQQKLRRIAESGDIQLFLTLLADSGEELKINITAYTRDPKWAEDYSLERG